MLNSFIAELDKTKRRAAIWGLGAVFIVLGIVFNYVIPYFTYTFPSSSATPASLQQLFDKMMPGQMIPNMISGFPLFGGAIALIVGALLVGSEFGWGTFKTIFTQRPSRLRVVGGKLLVLALMLLLFTLAIFAAGALASLIMAKVEGGPIDWPAAGEFLRALGIGWFILVAWGALGAALAGLFRGTALAVGLGLVYVLVIEGLLRGFAAQSAIISDIVKALPGPNAGSLASTLIPSSLSIDTPGLISIAGAMQSGLILGAYLLGFAAICALVLVKRDVA